MRTGYTCLYAITFTSVLNLHPARTTASLFDIIHLYSHSRFIRIFKWYSKHQSSPVSFPPKISSFCFSYLQKKINISLTESDHETLPSAFCIKSKHWNLKSRKLKINSLFSVILNKFKEIDHFRLQLKENNAKNL